MSQEATAETVETREIATGAGDQSGATAVIDTTGASRPEEATRPNSWPLLLDRYEIRRPLSKGGFATVYEGYDPRIKRAVAIKRCSSLDEENHERFFREAEIAGNLSHPNIVRIFDFGVAEGVPFIVQELLDGKDLADWIESGLDLSRHDRARILLEIGRGLAYAHSHDVIHRDIKPANVRVLDDGSIKLLDFGVAAIQAAPSDLTQTGTTVGTAAYLAPEQIQGKGPARATDVFSFGVLAYELLSGHRPFEGETLSAVLYQIAHQQPEELRSGTIPTRLTRLVHRCLAKQPQHRPPSFEEITTELQTILRDPRLTPGLTSPFTSAATDFPSSAGLNTPRVGDHDSSPFSNRAPGQGRLDHPLRPATRPAQTLAAVPLKGAMRPLRDSSTRIQVARRPRRAPKLLIAIALLCGALALYPRFGGQLPEPISAAITEASQHMPEQVQLWLETFEEPGPPGLAVGVPSAGTGITYTEASAPDPSLGERGPESTSDPVTAVVELLKARRVPAPGSTERKATTTASTTGATSAVSTVDAKPLIRRAVSPSAPATVFLPPGWDSRMTVSIDGGGFQALDRRLTHRLTPGSHRLTFRLNTGSYQVRKVLDVELEPAETRTIRPPLAPPAALTITVLPKTLEGRIEIDGRRLSLPLDGPLVLEPSEHRVTLYPSPADPLGPLAKTIDLSPASGNKVTFDMRRRRAVLETEGAFEWSGE